MSIKDFYKDVIKSKKKSDKNNELSRLYERPVKERGDDIPHMQNFQPNFLHQCDTLYLPEQKIKKKTYKYLLVVVDVCTKLIDCEPYESLKQNDHEVLDCLKTIYQRGILKYPKMILFDNGTENKDHDIEKFLRNHQINQRFMVPGRYRQIANVKYKKKQIGSILFKFMANEELLTGQKVSTWVPEIRSLVEAINENLPPPITESQSDLLLSTKFSGDLIPIGTRVRTQLERPIDTVRGNLLPGKFRATDIKWSRDIERVEQILLSPNMPPLYLISGDDKLVARTKNQLQIVKKNEKAPDIKYIRGDADTAIIQEIIDKRKIGNKLEYLVKYKGYDETHNAWLNLKDLNRTADLKQMRREYDDEND